VCRSTPWLAGGALLLLAQLAHGQPVPPTPADPPPPTPAPTPPAGAPVAPAVPAVPGTAAAAPAPAGPVADDELPNPLPPAAAPVGGATQAATKALATATPLSGASAGTLGFPAMGASGVVAAIKLQGGTDQTTSFDVLAQIGQLRLTSWLALDILGERVTTAVPTATFKPGTGVPLPRLSPTNLTSVGFRLHLGVQPAVTEYQKISKCSTYAQAGATVSKAEAEECKAAGVDLNNAVEAATALEEAKLKGFYVDVGGRFLYRSEQLKGNAAGVAAELTPQFAWRGGAVFLSGAALWLGDSQGETDGIVSETAKVVELRSTLGVYFRFNKAVATTQVAPRVGLYGTYGRNFWVNRFAEAAGTASKVRGYQVEGGVFASGHFSGGFNGLVQFGVRRDFGPDARPAFLFSIIPSIGSDIAGAQ
jgi:hypothetical protein